VSDGLAAEIAPTAPRQHVEPPRDCLPMVVIADAGSTPRVTALPDGLDVVMRVGEAVVMNVLEFATYSSTRPEVADFQPTVSSRWAIEAARPGTTVVRVSLKDRSERLFRIEVVE